MEKFEMPELDVVIFENEDVITTSNDWGPGFNPDEGDGSFE